MAASNVSGPARLSKTLRLLCSCGEEGYPMRTVECVVVLGRQGFPQEASREISLGGVSGIAKQHRMNPKPSPPLPLPRKCIASEFFSNSRSLFRSLLRPLQPNPLGEGVFPLSRKLVSHCFKTSHPISIFDIERKLQHK